MERPKRILVVSHRFEENTGGLELLAATIANGMARRGFRVVWAASGTPARKEESIRRLPMRGWNLSEYLIAFPYPIWGPVSLFRLFREVGRCDVLHLHDCLYLGNVFAFLFATFFFRKPIIVTQHIDLVPYTSRLLRLLLHLAYHSIGWLVLSLSDQVVFYSYKSLQYFRGFVPFRRPPKVLLNGVNVEFFHPASQTEREALRRKLGWSGPAPVILFVGRFVEKKGLDLLRELVPRFPQCRWVFIGWGPKNPAQWGRPNLQYCGSMENVKIAPYYQAADLLILPSFGEGFPLVVQEAMSCGTPALISEETAQALPGIENFAFLSNLEVVDLALSLRTILDSPERLSAMRQAVADFARTYWRWEKTLEQYARIFAEQLG